MFALFHICVIRPQLTLCHNGLDCVVHAFRWVAMFLQELLNHHPHFCSGGVAFLPINRAILTKRIRQLFCDGNQFFILIEVLNRLRLC